MNLLISIVVFQIMVGLPSYGLNVSYIGCFHDSNEWYDEVMDDFERNDRYQVSLIDCAKDLACMSRGRSYVTVVYYDLCLCSDKAPDDEFRVSEEMCVAPCHEKGLDCGGDGAFSLHHVTGNGHDSEGSLDDNDESNLLDFSEILIEVDKVNYNKKDLEEEIKSLDEKLADYESELITIKQKIVDNGVGCSIFGGNDPGSSNGTQWLEEVMKDPENAVSKIHNFIRSDKEKSIRGARTQLIEAKIKSLQDKKKDFEEGYLTNEQCSDKNYS